MLNNIPVTVQYRTVYKKSINLDYKRLHLRGFKFADKLLCDYLNILNAEQIMYACQYVL